MSIEIPNLIKIGYRTYEVIPLTTPDFEMTDKWGWCDKINAKIYIYTSEEPLVTADTLMHEVIHATWTWMGLDEKHDEEAAATRLGTGLINVFYENSDLLEYLLACVEYSQSDDDEEEDNNETRRNNETPEN